MLKRRIFAAVALSCAAAMPAHAQKTKAQIISEITTSLPENSVGAITPQALRNLTSDIVNSIMPTAPVAANNMICFNGTTGLIKDCGTNVLSLPVYVDNPVYGCVGNGIANDSACITAAVTAAAGVRPVLLSGKAYCIDPIKFGDGGLPVPPAFGGVGGSITELRACGVSASPTVTYSKFPIGSETGLHDLYINANSKHANAMLVHGCQMCTFEKIRTGFATSDNFVVHGEPNYNVQYSSFRDITSRDAGRHAFRFYSDNNVGDYYVAANVYSGLRGQRAAGDCFNIDYATVDPVGSEAESCAGYGINMDHTKGGTWTAVQVEGNGTGGLMGTANSTNARFIGGRLIDSISSVFTTGATHYIDSVDGDGNRIYWAGSTFAQNGSFAGGIMIGGVAYPGIGGINALSYYQNGTLIKNVPETLSNKTLAGPIVTGSLTATGLVKNADLVNSATTVNGQTCTLGSTCTVTAAASGVTVGTTTVGGGTTTRVLYDNAGVLGEYTAAQLTAQINPATTALSGALPAWPNNLTTFFRGDGAYATLNLGAVSGWGTGVQTAVSTAVGTAGAPVLFNGLGGTPSGIVLTNATGLPCGALPARTGDVTASAGSCVMTLATAQPAVHTWALAQTFTVAPVFTDASGSRTALGLGTMATQAASAVAITGGTINGTIGGTTPAAGTFTTVTGNTSVTSPLHYGGSSAGSTATINGTSSGSPSSAYLLLQSNGQNVGIGNTSPKAPLDLNENLASSPALVVSTSLARMQAADAALGGMEWVSYGASVQNVLAGATAGGTAGSPTATPATRNMFNLRGYGYTGTAWAVGGLVVIRSGDTGVWSGSNQGTQVDFYTTANSTTSLALAASFNPKGGLSIGAASVDAGAGTMLITPQLFSALTACSGTIKGAHAYVTDSSTSTWGATITGSGANNVLASCNGTNWTVAGK